MSYRSEFLTEQINSLMQELTNYQQDSVEYSICKSKLNKLLEELKATVTCLNESKSLLKG